MRCFNCMKELSRPEAICPHCGKPTNEKNPPHQLAAGTVLNNRYVVGNSIGEGGFGITYIGLDKTLDVRIAIKEYFPSGLANRISTYSNDVTVSQMSNAQTFEHGKENFLNEAKSVARFSKERNIVAVRDFFTGNNTAYIVMEYIDGETLSKHLREKGTFEPDMLINLMMPLMHSLGKMHTNKIIHRDISPENIMIAEDGSLILLDFGAARQFSDESVKTMSVILKQGYAPYEQYSTKIKQGPWTDVYALCATIYKCITGITPLDSLSRIVKDELKEPSELGVSINNKQEKALIHGLAIHPKYRIQNMSELIDAFTLKEAKVTPPFVAAKKQADTKHYVKAESTDTDPTVAADPTDTDLTVVADPTDTDLTVAADSPEGYRKITPEKPIPKEPTPIKNEPVKKESVEKEPEKKRSKKALIISGIAIALVAAIGIGVFFAISGNGQNSSEESNGEQVLQGDQILSTKSNNSNQSSADDFFGDSQVSSTESNDEKEISEKLSDPETIKLRDSLAQTISANPFITVGIKNNGTVVIAGRNDNNRCNVSDWKDIVSVSAGTTHIIGLKSDGTVVSTGYNGENQCNVSDWRDIISIQVNSYHTVGLKSNGTVVATGRNDYGQCNVSDWKDIVAVSTGGHHTVGLKSDGTVVAKGSNGRGECNVSSWDNISAVSAGIQHTVGLKSDGTVIATGNNNYGQCNVSGWKDIVAVSAGDYHTIGLKSDGTVVATTMITDLNDYDYGQCNVSDWTDIVEISAGYYHTVGLKSDGTVVATGSNDNGQCDVSDWKDIKLPANKK